MSVLASRRGVEAQAGGVVLPPLDLRLESTSITGKVDGDAIALWDGLVGSASQATGANQPLYKTAIINGLPVLRFDGSNDVLVSSLTNASAVLTIILVAKYRTASTNRAVAFSPNGGIIANGAAWAWYRNSASGISNLGGTATNFSIVTIRFDSTTSATPYVNGVAGTAFNASTSGYNGASALLLGADSSGGAEPGAVDLAAVFAKKAAMSNVDRGAWESFASSKYGIAI